MPVITVNEAIELVRTAQTRPLRPAEAEAVMAVLLQQRRPGRVAGAKPPASGHGDPRATCLFRRPTWVLGVGWEHA